MNYVIQNFNTHKQTFNLTPRLKNTFFFLYIKKIIFINKFIKLSSFSFFFFKIFIKYFYNNQIFFIFKKTSSELFSFYENNLFKASSYWIYKFFLLKQLKIDSLKIYSYFKISKFLFFNNIFFNVKTGNFKVTSTFYKNIFFFFLFHNIQFWSSFFCNFKFYLNFLHINENLTMYSFYNGYFFNIYHF